MKTLTLSSDNTFALTVASTLFDLVNDEQDTFDEDLLPLSLIEVINCTCILGLGERLEVSENVGHLWVLLSRDLMQLAVKIARAAEEAKVVEYYDFSDDKKWMSILVPSITNDNFPTNSYLAYLEKKYPLE